MRQIRPASYPHSGRRFVFCSTWQRPSAERFRRVRSLLVACNVRFVSKSRAPSCKMVRNDSLAVHINENDTSAIHIPEPTVNRVAVWRGRIFHIVWRRLPIRCPMRSPHHAMKPDNGIMSRKKDKRPIGHAKVHFRKTSPFQQGRFSTNDTPYCIIGRAAEKRSLWTKRIGKASQTLKV